MAFDPNKVERTKWVPYDYEGYQPYGISDTAQGDGSDPIRFTVESTDYDQLLEMYRELERKSKTAYTNLIEDGYHDDSTIDLGVALGLRSED